MSGWQTTKLGDVITDIAAGPFGSNLKVSCFVPDGFPIIDGANLKGTWLTDNITKFVTEEKARSLRRSIAKRNDVVVTISGTLGQIAFIPEHSKYEEYLCSQRQFRATFDSSRVDVAFLVYYFHTHEGQSKILAFANQVGVPALSQPLKNFREIQVSLPPLAEQRRIAGVLRAYDEAIENCRRQISLLEEAAQRLYKEWFREEGDEKKTVGDFVHVRRGKVITKATARTGTVPVIAAGLEPAYFTDSSNVKAPCVTISASGANAGYVSLHYEDIWASDCSFVSRTETPFVFFSYELLKDKADWIRGLQKGSAQPHVHASDLEGVEMFLPDEERIREYEQRVSPLFQTCRALTRQVRLFEEARDRLLPRLLSGEASA